MARGRMISGTIGESRKFAALSSDTHRMMYLMVLPHVDKAGRFEADPILIRGRCFTRLDVEPTLIQAWLNDAANVGLIHLYEADGVPVLEIVNFLEHNTPHHKEPESKLPERPLDTQETKHDASMVQAQAKHEPTLTIREVKEREVKEKGIKENKKAGDSEKPKAKTEKFDPLQAELPDNVPPELWAEFVAHRSEIKKKLTPTATKQLLTRLRGFGPSAGTALRDSIANGWTGVFPPKDKPGTKTVEDDAGILDQYKELGL